MDDDGCAFAKYARVGSSTYSSLREILHSHGLTLRDLEPGEIDSATSVTPTHA